jgi:hypothetical protein
MNENGIGLYRHVGPGRGESNGHEKSQDPAKPGANALMIVVFVLHGATPHEGIHLKMVDWCVAQSF